MAVRRVLVLLGWLLGAALGRRLVCWEAMLQCQKDAECRFAYSQYSDACAPVMPRPGEALSPAASHSSPSRRRCPSHCISALIYLNNTRGGPALEDCDCYKDDLCKATKRAIEPCLPRTSGGSAAGGGGTVAAGGGGGGGGSSAGGGAVMGCMEARRLCETDRRCQVLLTRYLTSCGRLFNGMRCTEQCLAVIEDMMRVPRALLLSDCVCDGHERAICETLKENMARLCFGSEIGNGGPGSSGHDYEYGDDEDDEDVTVGDDAPSVNGDPPGNSAPPLRSFVTLGTAVVLKLLLLG